MPTLEEIEAMLKETAPSGAAAPPSTRPTTDGLDPGPAADPSLTQLPAFVVEAGDEPMEILPQEQSRRGEMSLDEIEALLKQPETGGALGQGGTAPTGEPQERGAFDRLQAWQGPAGNVRGPIMDMARSFNTQVANALGFPIEVVNEALGLAGMNFLEQGGDAQKAFRNAFRSLGIDVREEQASGFFEKVGDQILPAVLTLFGLFGGAARLTQVQAPGAIGNIVRETGKFVQQHPTATVTGTAAALPGMVFGAESGAQVGEAVGGDVGRVIGETVGGVVGGGTTGAVGMAGTRFQPKVTRGPIIDKTADPMRPRIFAENQINREKRAVDDAIDAALNQIRDAHKADPFQASARAFDALKKVHDNARKVEQKLWAKVDKNAQVSLDKVRPLIDKLKADIDLDPSIVPSKWLSRLQKLDRAQGGVATVHQLRTIRSGILRDRWEAGQSSVQGRAPNNELKARLAQLEDGIMNAIDEALGPNNLEWQTARAFSREVNNRFHRGEIGRVLNLDYQSQFRTNPEEMVAALLRKPRGLKAVQEAADINAAPAGSGGYARLQGSRQMLDETETAVKEFLVDMVDREIRRVEGLAPGTGRRAGALEATDWIAKNEGRLNNLARLGKETLTVRVQLEAALQRNRDIDAGALAQYLRRDPDNAVREMFSTGDPSLVARQLMREFRMDTPMHGNVNLDPEALMGFKRAIADELISRSRGSMVKMEEIISTPKYARMLGEVWGVDFARIQNLVKAGAALERGEARTAKTMIGKGATWFAHVVGLLTGKFVASATMAGQAGRLSLPFRIASAFRAWVSKHFEQIPQSMFAEALVNPDQERLLLSRIPGSEREAKEFLSRMRKVITRLQTGRYSEVRLLEELAKGAPEEDF